MLEHYGFDEPTDFSVQSDLPAAAGLGNSSAFTVSVINLVSHLMGTPRTRMELAREAIHTEQVLLKENVGVQDQLHASFGGINRFDLFGDSFRIAPVNIAGRDLKVLADWMLLVYTGVKRRATAVVAEQVENTSSGALDAELREMLAYVDAAQEILEDAAPGRRTGANRRAVAPELAGQEAAVREGQRAGNRRALRILPRQRGDRRQIMRRRRRRVPADGGAARAPGAFEAAVGERQCVRFEIDCQGTALLASSAPLRPLG